VLVEWGKPSAWNRSAPRRNSAASRAPQRGLSPGKDLARRPELDRIFTRGAALVLSCNQLPQRQGSRGVTEQVFMHAEAEQLGEEEMGASYEMK